MQLLSIFEIFGTCRRFSFWQQCKFFFKEPHQTGAKL
jgi:hypothetical protein